MLECESRAHHAREAPPEFANAWRFVGREGEAPNFWPRVAVGAAWSSRRIAGTAWRWLLGSCDALAMVGSAGYGCVLDGVPVLQGDS